MKVTYLNHSGFLLEWEHSYWLFDYYKGTIPPLNPKKDILVFCSHSHHDHFNPEIFHLLSECPSITYIFSTEIRRTCKHLQNKGIISPSLPINFLKSRTDTCLTMSNGEIIKIHTLQSTDCGCAFYIEYNGKTIYHAGDLHWWYWEGEDISWNNHMTAAYKKEMEYLKDQIINLAFTPLDPRQEKDYSLGMNYFLNNTLTCHMFPMHFWDNFDIIEQYQQEYSIPESTTFYTLCQNGQSFEIMV